MSSLIKSGKFFTSFFESNGFFLLNGRTKNDYPAQFTYHETAGVSVIDLVWCNLECSEFIADFRVLLDFRGSHII